MHSCFVFVGVEARRKFIFTFRSGGWLRARATRVTMGHKSNLSLASFFIFNSRFGPKEGQEEKKILFYYPYDSSADERIKNVGLSEAIIQFTNTFADTANTCQLTRTLKKLTLFHQPEPDYWMVMCINVPHEQRRPSVVADGTAAATTAAAGNQPPPSSQQLVDYKGDNVHERIYRQLLVQAYRMFRLFCGRFAEHLDDSGPAVDRHADDDDAPLPVRLLDALNDFYTRYLGALRLDRCDIVDVFGSCHFQPVDRLLFLQIHTAVQLVQARFPAIRHCILLSEERLVWSELNPEDMYAVYEYLTQMVFPHSARCSMGASSAAAAAASGGGGESSAGERLRHYGAFVTAPTKFQNSVAIPRVHVYNRRTGGDDSDEDAPCEIFDLVIYRHGDTAIGMFFDQSAERTDDTYHELHTFVGPQLAAIGAAIADQRCSDATATGADGGSGSVAEPRYLFFNELSLRHTGTVHLRQAGRSPPTKAAAAVPTEVMNLLADLYDVDDGAGGRGAEEGDRRRLLGVAEETVLKTLNDYWIVRRSSGGRHGYVVVNKSSTLMSVAEEARAVFAAHASNVFFDK